MQDISSPTFVFTCAIYPSDPRIIQSIHPSGEKLVSSDYKCADRCGNKHMYPHSVEVEARSRITFCDTCDGYFASDYTTTDQDCLADCSSTNYGYVVNGAG